MKWLSKLLDTLAIPFMHDWYHGCYSMNELRGDKKWYGIRSKYTGDLIGRHERHCKICDLKQISLSQFSKQHQQMIIDTFQDFTTTKNVRWYTYKSGDALDEMTKGWLTENKA